jgi:hypothetical protein
MSQAERYAWASLAAWTLILFYLLTRFTTGVEIFGQSLGMTLVEHAPSKLLWTYVTLMVIAVVAESIIAAALARTGADDIEKDERDHAIERRANLAAYWFTAVALNAMVVHVLATATYGSYVDIDLTSPTGIAFALLVVLIGAEIVKRLAVIWSYRAA